MDVQGALVLFSSIALKTLRQLSVCIPHHTFSGVFSSILLTIFIAKFSGYLYGGRPLGLSYVKYTNNYSSNNEDAMEGAPTLTQDQIM